MFLRLYQVSTVISAALLASSPAAASTITSSNGLDNIGFASSSSFSSLYWSGSPPSWYNSVTSENGASGFSGSPFTSVVVNGATYGVSGANGTGAGSIEGFSATPMIFTPPGGDTALTAIAFELTTAGNIVIQLTLSDGSTVSATDTGNQTWISILSPLQITAIQLSGSGNTFSIQDIETGTANSLDLPSQPDDGGSSVPESASMWLVGGGLIVFGRFLRHRCNGA